jgi:flagellar motor switch/type III secretory pathway protein FliN
MDAVVEKSTALAIASGPAHSDWETVQALPCRLTLELSVPAFTVAALLRLAPGDVIDTRWRQGSDVPLRANGVLIGWTEFEVLGDNLAARVTQIA